MIRARLISAFSLIELMVVMAIIAIMLAFVVPAGNTMKMGSRLTDALARVDGALNTARQTAIAHNHTVEVRFYQFADPEVPGETANSPSTGRFRAVQIFEYLDSGAAMAVTKMERLPDGIAFDAGYSSDPTAAVTGTKATSLSTLLGKSQVKTFSPLDPQVSLPRNIGTSYNCCAFQILPSGMTSLTFGYNWFITIHLETAGDRIQPPSSGAMKVNYATVQIDPVSASSKYFRP